MVDENEFFRNITLRICGSLEIEEGLQSCIEYLSQHIPADALYLERYEPDLDSMRVITRARVGMGEKMNLLIPMSEEAKAAMAQLGGVWREGMLPPVLVINRSQEEPVTKCILETLGEPVSSAMSLPLIIEDRIVGALAVIAEGDDRYDDYHARLYATLKEPFFIAMSNILKHEEVVHLKNLLADDNQYLHRELLRISGDEIVGADFGLREVMRKVRHVAPTESPVLLTGETGVGKDVIANAIHLNSTRRDGPFIPVNCGAIPESLLDSELFGHEKGAFTGALSQKRGRFERADQGTVFLDEIGEMPLEAQVRLLRVLQHREIERIGGVERIPVDIRIIAATNQNLEEMVKAGSFREDLWFRLNVFPIAIPPLRERSNDIPALVQHLIERKSGELKIAVPPPLAPGAMDDLMTYHWPGNVRELENLIERAMILYRDDALHFDTLRSASSKVRPPATPENDEELVALDTLIARHIKSALDKTNGKIHGPAGAAKMLGINASTLRYRMDKLGITYGRNWRD